jgi:hypothetical protein
MLDIGANLQAVRQRIAAAAHRAGRSPDEIALLAVSKRVDRRRIEAALAAGVRALGESRVQEAEAKIPEIRGAAAWHFIGPLQRNKATLAGRLFDVVHSLDRDTLVDRLSAGATAAGRTVGVYVQVEAIAGPPGKEVVEATGRLCRSVAAAEGLRLAGLMTMAPYDPDPEVARPYFAALRALRDGVAESCEFADLGLSMGMSGDFEVAIEEGATIVRVGTAIFGERSP